MPEGVQQDQPDPAGEPVRGAGGNPAPVTPGVPGPVPGPAPGPGPAPEPELAPPPRPSRLGGLWIILTSGAVILILLLVFVLQNGQRVQIHLYGAHWNAPLGVALLMAAALGVLLVLVPGAGRIIQLRRAAKHLHQDRERLSARLDEARQTPNAPQ